MVPYSQRRTGQEETERRSSVSGGTALNKLNRVVWRQTVIDKRVSWNDEWGDEDDVLRVSPGSALSDFSSVAAIQLHQSLIPFNASFF